MIGLIISGGNKVEKELLNKYSKNAYIVCADGGIKNFIDTEISPNIIVGDFDSIDEIGKDFILKKGLDKITYPNEKDFTDTEAAVEKIMQKDVDEIIILGATGTRIDHTLGNLSLLQKLYNKIKTTLLDSNNEITYVEEGEFEFTKGEYKYISVISLSETLEYSTKGFKYEVDHLEIKSSSSRGISNEILNESANLIVHRGRAYIIKSKD